MLNRAKTSVAKVFEVIELTVNEIVNYALVETISAHAPCGWCGECAAGKADTCTNVSEAWKKNCVPELRRDPLSQKIFVQVGTEIYGKISVLIHLRHRVSIRSEDLNRLKGVLGHRLTIALSVSSSRLRDAMITHIFDKNDVASFSFKALEIGAEVFGYEAGSIFSHDDRTELLRLSSTTGLTVLDEQKNTKKGDIFYQPGSKSWVARCYREQSIICETSSDRDLPTNTYGERVNGVENRAYIPIKLRPLDANTIASKQDLESRNKHCVGVLRLINFPGVSGTSFNALTLSVLQNFAEYVYVLMVRYLAAGDVRSHFGRATHGFFTDLSNMRMTLDEYSARIVTLVQVVERADQQGSLSSSDRIIFEEFRNKATIDLRDIYATHESMAAQLHNVLDSTEFAFAETLVSNEPCSKPYKDVLLRVKDAAPRIARTVDRKAPLVYISKRGGSDPEAVRRMPALDIPQEELYLIMRNLVENSIKYCDYCDNPTVSIDWTELQDSVQILVTDNGVGISAVEADRIFDETYRTRAAVQHSTRGNGLGLYMSRGRVRVYGGELEYIGEGKKGTGSTFAVTIPKAKS